MRCPSLRDLPPPPEAKTIWPWTRGSQPLPERMPNGQPWPLVSIVTPALNHGRFLEEAIRSVLLQGYPRIELIVCDGGSTDETVAVLARYQPWLKYWVSEEDDGPAGALNKGFGVATGEVFGFLNADDFLLPGCLEKVAHEFAEHREVDVVSGHGYFTTPAGELAMPTYSDAWSFVRFCHAACVLVQPATFFRREAFDRAHGFRAGRSTCWDMELWADMARAGATFRTMAAFVAACRLHSESITGHAGLRERRVRDAVAVMEELRGRPATAIDRFRCLFHRAIKFSRHPHRTLRQRYFFFTTLHRWSL